MKIGSLTNNIVDYKIAFLNEKTSSENLPLFFELIKVSTDNSCFNLRRGRAINGGGGKMGFIKMGDFRGMV